MQCLARFSLYLTEALLVQSLPQQDLKLVLRVESYGSCDMEVHGAEIEALNLSASSLSCVPAHFVADVHQKLNLIKESEFVPMVLSFTACEEFTGIYLPATSEGYLINASSQPSSALTTALPRGGGAVCRKRVTAAATQKGKNANVELRYRRTPLEKVRCCCLPSTLAATGAGNRAHRRRKEGKGNGEAILPGKGRTPLPPFCPAVAVADREEERRTKSLPFAAPSETPPPPSAATRDDYRCTLL
nr:hypothetical protein Iba_chr10eCG10470 [Ipomoea batatas]